MSYPSDLQYTEQHEWVRVEGNVATVGITHHAQEQLGDLVHVDLPAVGAKLSKGGSAGTVESVKAVSDVYSPLSGTVTEVNTALDGNEGVINSDPHNEGWLFKLNLSQPSELSGLLSAADYEKIA